MRISLDDHVNFKSPFTGIYDRNDPDCEGRVDDISFSGEYIYVTNMNMPFMGIFRMRAIPVSDVIWCSGNK